MELVPTYVAEHLNFAPSIVTILQCSKLVNDAFIRQVGTVFKRCR